MQDFKEAESTRMPFASVVVGGEFDEHGGRASMIVASLAKCLQATEINGGHLGALLDARKEVASPDVHLSVWMPNISNDQAKTYPRKRTGSVLICSKRIRNGNDDFTAVSRIYAMHANAVIAIYKRESHWAFKLIDALANVWVDTPTIEHVAEKIQQLTYWTHCSVRLGSHHQEDSVRRRFPKAHEGFLPVVHRVSELVQASAVGRYFGNASTRCTSLFPSAHSGAGEAWVSARNTDKQKLTSFDMIRTRLEDDRVLFSGTSDDHRKPSVDTPVQLKLYDMYPRIEYMIHGHAHVVGAQMTETHYPCGDLREVGEIANILRVTEEKAIAINLRDHGFLLLSPSLPELEEFVGTLRFEPARRIAKYEG